MKHSAAERSRKHRAAEARRLRNPAAGPSTRAEEATVSETLAQQNADLTAEGSPPPGKVGLGVPVTPRRQGSTAAPVVPVAAAQ